MYVCMYVSLAIYLKHMVMFFWMFFEIVKNIRQLSRAFSMPQVDNVTWMICRQKKHFFIHFPSHS